MRTNTFNTLSATALSIALVTLTAGCGNNAEHSDTVGTEATSGTTDPSAMMDGTGTSEIASDGPMNGTVARDGASTMDANEIRINGSAVGTPAYNERYAASKDVRGYRALLMAELEVIRERLNDGTRDANIAKKDQERAADLAQGLERMDRLIIAVEESDDVTWTSIRTSSLKEAGEVRVWATEHGYKLSV